jgi:hypothetical protein
VVEWLSADELCQVLDRALAQAVSFRVAAEEVPQVPSVGFLQALAPGDHVADDGATTGVHNGAAFQVLLDVRGTSPSGWDRRSAGFGQNDFVTLSVMGGGSDGDLLITGGIPRASSETGSPSSRCELLSSNNRAFHRLHA